VQKNQKRSGLAASANNVRHQARRYPVPLPEVVSSDVLGTMLDEDLIVRLRVLDEHRNKVYEAHIDPRPWEEEIAYLRREQQVRRGRRDVHAAYVRKIEEEFNRIEAVLPAGDFDNSVFVYAATGGRPRWN
jgi:hypothetical protein